MYKHIYRDVRRGKRNPPAETDTKLHLKVNMCLQSCELAASQVMEALSALIVFGNVFLKRHYCYSWYSSRSKWLFLPMDT